MPYADTHAAVTAEGYEGDAIAELLAAHDEDSGLSAAMIAELTDQNLALTAGAEEAAGIAAAEIQRLQAVNYTLLEASGTADGGAQIEEFVDETDPDEPTFDQIFESNIIED